MAIFLSSTPDPAAILPLATMMMIGLSAYAMADAVILIVGGVLRGAGDTKWLMWASILLHWLMLIVEVFVIEVWNTPELGSRTAWLVFVTARIRESVRQFHAATYTARLYRGRWYASHAGRRSLEAARVLSEHASPARSRLCRRRDFRARRSRPLSSLTCSDRSM